jgi:hypothetical protein
LPAISDLKRIKRLPKTRRVSRSQDVHRAGFHVVHVCKSCKM